MSNILRTLLHCRDSLENLNDANQLIGEVLSICQHALRTSVHTTLGSSPGALVFKPQYILIIPLLANWHVITTKREQVINENLCRMNKNDGTMTIWVAKKVLKLLFNPTKFGKRTMDSYTRQYVHVNGNLTIKRRTGILLKQLVYDRPCHSERVMIEK